MATDPPTPDLGAIRARLMSYPRVTMYDDDVQALVAAYDEREALLERIREDAIRLIAAYDAQQAWLSSLDADVVNARNSALALEGAYRDLEEAYHAQAARLTAVEAERDQARELVKYTLAQRDDAKAKEAQAAQIAQDCHALHQAAEIERNQVRKEREKAQALVIERLAALEQAPNDYAE